MSKNMLVILVLNLLVSACSVSMPKESPQEKILLDSADSKSIIKFYKRNLSKNPEYKAKLVSQYLDVNDIKSAQLYANTYNGNDFNNPLFLHTLSRLSVAKKEYGTAEEQINKYLNVGGNKTKYHLLVAKIFALQGRFDKAESNFLEAKKLGESDARIANDLAVIKMMQKKYAEAVELLYNIYLEEPQNEKVKANLLISAANSGLDDITLNILERGSNNSISNEKLEKLMVTIRERNENVETLHQDVSMINQYSEEIDKHKPVTAKNEVSHNKVKSYKVQHYRKVSNDNSIRVKERPMKMVRGVTKQSAHNYERNLIKRDIIYRVQILATYQPLEKEYVEYLKSKYGQLYEYESGLITRYCLGGFNSITEAKSFLKRTEFKDGFVVNYGTMEYKAL